VHCAAGYIECAVRRVLLLDVCVESTVRRVSDQSRTFAHSLTTCSKALSPGPVEETAQSAAQQSAPPRDFRPLADSALHGTLAHWHTLLHTLYGTFAESALCANVHNVLLLYSSPSRTRLICLRASSAEWCCSLFKQMYGTLSAF